jgi:hypothetical protein
MNLKKLIDLEATVLQEGPAPHEQDDTTLGAYTPQYQSTGIGYPSGTATTTGIATVTTTGGSNIAIGTPSGWTQWPLGVPAPSSVTNGARPTVEIEDDDVVLTMSSGKEMVFQSSAGAAINISSNTRKFRMTRKQAQELAILLVKAAAEDS